MEEMTTPVVEEVSADQADVFDGWDEPGTEDVADQPEAEVTEEPAAEPAAEPEEEAPPAEQSDVFLTLKHMDETRTVTREEAVELAQKGMDYDRIRTERDQLKASHAENEAAMQMVRKYAERLNMTVPEYLDYCRTQELMSEKSISEEAAKEQLSLEKREMAVAQKEAEQQAKEEADAQQKQQEESAQDKIRREVAEFIRHYPEVKPEDIPKEVFETIQREDVSLSVAYGKWRIAQQEHELTALRSQDSARKRTPGSMATTQRTPKSDPVYAGWDD